ncbi:MAG: EAL domain-containing protein [Trueperaceae bacterium]|nr:EAL domain-containing protein [Trueperaceae bacterium]
MIDHPLLKRQLKTLGLAADTQPQLDAWKVFLQRINAAYHEEDQGRYLLERSLTLSSDEMRELNEELRTSTVLLEADKQKLERWQLFHRDLISFVTEALYSGMEDDFYKRVLDFALLFFPQAEAGSVLQRDELNSFYFVAAKGFDLQELQTLLIPEEAMLIEAEPEPRVVYRNEEAYQKEANPSDQLKRLRIIGRVDEIKATLFIPILFEDKLIASINLDSFSQTLELDEELYAMIRVFSTQIGVLLQRFRLSGELEASNRRLENLANFDPLTGLPNRSHFLKRLNSAIEEQVAGFALLFIDLDGFKLVNDSLGHTYGDRLLLEVAKRLRKSVRRSDFVSRLGGDEFTIIVNDLENPVIAVKIADKILKSFMQPFSLEGNDFKVTASIGIAHYPAHSQNAQLLIKQADIAMYQAKNLGRNRSFLFTEELDQSVNERIHLLQDLRRAIDKGELELYYQPRIALQDLSMTSVEALLRWQHPKRGFVSPAIFIPLAEESGLIHALGQWVLHEVCQQLGRWQSEGISTRIAVNVSMHELQAEGFVNKTKAVLEHNHINAALLELEITESAAMYNVELNIDKLERLQAHGIKLAIDDFGTAYSSLNYLKRLPVHSLKIDRSFIMDIDENESVNKAIVRSIIALAKSMELEVVAEGVETLAQVEFLRALGCDEAQGYYFSRPVPVKSLEPFFAKESQLLSPFN